MGVMDGDWFEGRSEEGLGLIGVGGETNKWAAGAVESRQILPVNCLRARRGEIRGRGLFAYFHG